MSAELKSYHPDFDLTYVYSPRRVTPKVVAGTDLDGPFGELAVVALVNPTSTFDGYAVAANSVGTIVSVYDDGAGYDVEFDEGIAAVIGTDLRLA